MMHQPAPWGDEPLSFDAFAERLGRAVGVSRRMRRVVLADCRKLLRVFEASGVPGERVLFTVLRCSCCDALEVKASARRSPGDLH